MSGERTRLEEARAGRAAWKKWGPYLSERQWGTVREDYSRDGDAWNHFSHDQARSRAYRWGEDGLAGISDDRQTLCFALALWNGRDAILKERLFGLTNNEGNHGEDVKEQYFYLDSTPTHSYMRYLYKYPQAAYPYSDLVLTNRGRGRQEPEYELIDTGVFADGRYFDVFVEYAKAAPEDLLVRITVHNRGPEGATLEVLPTLWFRNDWTWRRGAQRPVLRQVALGPAGGVVAASHPTLGDRLFLAEGAAALLFTENETNQQRLYGAANPTQFVKDGIDAFVVHGDHTAVNPAQVGTKVAARYPLELAPGESRTLRLRLTEGVAEPAAADAWALGSTFDATFETLRREADEFYATVIPSALTADQTAVMRQALAGMLWTKQLFLYDVDQWLEEHGVSQFATARDAVRNARWRHMHNADVISMPDKWEYPWYAAWDLAFHTTALSLVDPDFAKDQLELFLAPRYLHPSGQIPAYEWNFGDVNPPVHAWSTIFTYLTDRADDGQGDIAWLERCFHKLLLNFNWWVNRKDRFGDNAFEGGFLGLDNIGVFDRSSPLPTGGYLEQADGTAWMALYCQNMVEISAELTLHNPAYVELADKFVQHFLLIASGMVRPGQLGMWDERDGFFYDLLRLPDGESHRLKVRSMVGLLPLCAATVFESKLLARYPQVVQSLRDYLAPRPELTAFIHDPTRPGHGGRRLLSILDETNLRRVLSVMLDEEEFLSPFGIRSLSRAHRDRPYTYWVGDRPFTVGYVPGESDTGMFGGNSNWRGPIWMPVNMLIVRALLQYFLYHGNDFRIECPTGSGRLMNLFEVAREISRRLAAIFLPGADGRRPVDGGAPTFLDPHWRDLVLFYEYFHGDTGAGLGASHQTGWTGAVARLLHGFATVEADSLLAKGKLEALADTYRPRAG